MSTLCEKPHWIVGGKKFYNKLSAVASSEASHTPIQFDLFNDDFDNLDWSKEPSASWETLLHLRALQIRQSYDYVRLWYSGGADSHTILLTFLRNRIPLDEIVMIRRSVINRFNEGIANTEINDAAIPFLKMVEADLLGAKITILDMGHDVFARSYVPDDNWLYRLNNLSFLPDNATAFELNLGGIHDRSLSRRTYCDLDGYEKPKLTKRDGKYYAFFWDGAFQRGIGRNEHQIPFYVSPEFPELHLKQCHQAKNFIESRYPGIEKVDAFFDSSQPEYVEMTFSCRYPLHFDVSSLRLGKSKTLFSPKTEELLGQAKKADTTLYEAYFSNLRSENRLHHHRYNNNNIAFELKGIKTREYCLGG